MALSRPDQSSVDESSLKGRLTATTAEGPGRTDGSRDRRSLQCCQPRHVLTFGLSDGDAGGGLMRNRRRLRFVHADGRADAG
jgi:hypothetical protein